MKTFVLNITFIATLLWVAPVSASDDLATLLSPHKGRVVLVDFWASWCGPCLRSFPWMNELESDLGPAGLVVIAINVDSEREAADQFLSESPARFSLVFDPDGNYARQLNVDVMPSSFLFDRAGELVHHQRGFQTKDAALYRSLIEIELKR